jgi:glycosyltransferase involved in cell wall biosynthesis
MDFKNKNISVVIPVYNSSKTLFDLNQKICNALFPRYESFEIIYINDGSSDDSWLVLQKIFEKNKQHVIAVDIASNSGQQNALMCGLKMASGDIVVTLDDDLQNRPEDIPKLIDKIQEGWDAVFAAYASKQHRFYQNLGSLAIRKLNQQIFQLPDDLRFSSFRALRKELVAEIVTAETAYPYLSGLICERTKKVANVTVEHCPRQHGKSNYTFAKLFSLALNLIINYSTIPLKVVGYFGISIAFFVGFWASVMIYKQVSSGTVPAGYTSTILFISVNSIVNIIMLITIGIYLQRILKELSSKRIIYIRTICKLNEN